MVKLSVTLFNVKQVLQERWFARPPKTSHPFNSFISSSLVGGLGIPGSPDREGAESCTGPPGRLNESPGPSCDIAAPPTCSETFLISGLPTFSGGGCTSSSLNSLLGGPDGQFIIVPRISGECFIVHIQIASLSMQVLSKDQQYLVVLGPADVMLGLSVEHISRRRHISSPHTAEPNQAGRKIPIYGINISIRHCAKITFFW